MQGFVEDQFGLGLIARAVEEGISVIKPMGIMIFNMGGRPGQGVCKRLFERRGFRINKLWQTKILQASKSFSLEIILSIHIEFIFIYCIYRRLTLTSLPWLKLRRTVHIVLSFLWDFQGISLFVLEQHGLMGRLVVASLMHYQFIAVNSVSQIRFCTLKWFLK